MALGVRTKLAHARAIGTRPFLRIPRLHHAGVWGRDYRYVSKGLGTAVRSRTNDMGVSNMMNLDVRGQ